MKNGRVAKSDPPAERAAYSPAEFAALFGKSVTWGYRQLYSGRVKAITGEGRLLIPASEVQKITASAAIYDGVPSKKKVRVPKPAKVKIPKAWPDFVRARCNGGKPEGKVGEKAGPDGSSRSAALRRLTKNPSAKVTPPKNEPS